MIARRVKMVREVRAARMPQNDSHYITMAFDPIAIELYCSRSQSVRNRNHNH
jgi:hypothetical protein